jgi:regulator of replication initiation timing
MSLDNKIDEALRAMTAHLLRENEELIESRKRVAESRDKFIAENGILKADLISVTGEREELKSSVGFEIDAHNATRKENERLRNRIAKLQSMGAVDVEALKRELADSRFDCSTLQNELGGSFRERDRLRAQIDELTKHNHALAERAKKAEVRHQIADSVNVTFCAGVLKSIHINGIPTSPDCVLTMTHVPKGLPELKCILKYETCYGEDQ